MSTTPSSSAPNAWLVLLVVIWAGLLFGTFGLGVLQKVRRQRPPAAASERAKLETSERWTVPTRLVSSLVLVIAAWSWLAAAWATPVRGYALLTAAGMTLGFVGDLFMARVIPLAQHILGGMAAFGAGHAAYIAAAVSYAASLNKPAGVRLAAWAAWLAVGAVGWYVVALRQARPPTALHWAALPYALLLSSTAGAATGLALQAAGFVPLALGAALFLFSDLLIAAGLFSQRRFRGQDDVIWLTYGTGQALIVYSIGAALARAGG